MHANEGVEQGGNGESNVQMITHREACKSDWGNKTLSRSLKNERISKNWRKKFKPRDLKFFFPSIDAKPNYETKWWKTNKKNSNFSLISADIQQQTQIRKRTFHKSRFHLIPRNVKEKEIKKLDAKRISTEKE